VTVSCCACSRYRPGVATANAVVRHPLLPTPPLTCASAVSNIPARRKPCPIASNAMHSMVPATAGGKGWIAEIAMAFGFATTI
jgi:hypothetical protein